jgi:Carboxypeptidase regulatory-like domain
MRSFRFAAILASFVMHSLSASAQPAPERPPAGPRLADAATALPVVPAGTVTLTLAEYDRLVDLSARPARPPEVPPVGAVLTRADLRVRVDGIAARGTFTIDGEVLRTGPTRVDLVAGGSGGTVLDARAAGRPVPLLVDVRGHATLLPGPGPFSVAVDWGTPLKSAPGRVSFFLPAPAAGSTRAFIDVPGDDTDVHISMGLLTRKTSAAGRTIAEVTLDPGSLAEVSWSVRATTQAAPARDARLLADLFTLVTIAESEVRLASLVDVTVVQGDPRTIEVTLPNGYEVSSVTGSSIETSDERSGRLILTLNNPALRRHQFLVALEQAHAGGSFTLETGFPALPSAERERGEVAVAGIGTLDLAAPERAGIRRVDVREVDPALAALSRQPLAAAFRYRRAAAAPPSLALEIRRFPDAAVLAAVAERATATTLVNPQGRALTEIVLRLQNRAQSFLKVALPQGASIVSVEVAGQPAKPALASDGMRLPLIRPGFRPTGPYTMSFVYVHSGAPFARKGEQQMTLPKMDIPIGLVEWEVFVPDRFSVSRFGGNMITGDYITVTSPGVGTGQGAGGTFDFSAGGGRVGPAMGAAPGQIIGRVTDTTGAVLPGVTVTVKSPQGAQTVVTDEEGRYRASNVESGQVEMTAELAGFGTSRQTFQFNQQPRQVDFVMSVSSLQETVTVQAEPPVVSSSQTFTPSANVQNLQRRAAGVLPVRVDVPRAGSSLRFVKPLVVDQEAMVSFRYKRR